MRATLGTLALVLLLAGCGSTADDSSSPGDSSKPKPNPGAASAALVQQRYGDCLLKLRAKPSQALEFYVSYTTKAGFLTFHVTKGANGKTFTSPAKAKDVDILSSVGC